MIKIENLSKSFGSKQVLKNLTLTIKDNSIFGLIGINGAGKSTLLRILANVYDSDSGSVLFDGNILNSIDTKKQIFFLPDDPYFEENKNIKDMLEFYQTFYEFDRNKFYEYLKAFKITSNENYYLANFKKFSKGMKRQVYVCLALAIAPKYLFLDEAFDGLDPLARLTFKRLILKIMEDNDMTVIISSHSLRELEDICDSYGLLDGGIIESSGTIEDDLNKYYKYQLAFDKEVDLNIFSALNYVSLNKVGRIVQIICQGEQELIETLINSLNPILIDKLPIDFEELFVIKVEKAGYLRNEK